MLLFRHFESFPFPDSLDPFVIHSPAFEPKHRGDPSVAVASVHAGKIDDPLRQRPLVIAYDRQVALRCPWLFQYLACPPLGNFEAIEEHPDRFTLPVRA